MTFEKDKELKKEIEKQPKVRASKILVRMYHQNKSVIDISEKEVKAHLAAGWRLEE